MRRISSSCFSRVRAAHNVLGAVIAAVAIWRNLGWGWALGVAVVGLSFVLYLAQETVGLPGLPQNWWEPSRIVSLIVEALFIVVAWKAIVHEIMLRHGQGPGSFR
jgi:uncharacterized membrane protein YhdT